MRNLTALVSASILFIGGCSQYQQFGANYKIERGAFNTALREMHRYADRLAEICDTDGNGIITEQEVHDAILLLDTTIRTIDYANSSPMPDITIPPFPWQDSRKKEDSDILIPTEDKSVILYR